MEKRALLEPREPMPTALATPALIPNPVISRAQAIDLVTSKASAPYRTQILSADRVEAKLVTIDEFQRISSTEGAFFVSAPARLVWAVAFGGQYRPQFGRGEVFPWGVLLFDAATGAPMGSHADVKGTWPGYWSQLPDRSPK
jgi:hypothetical protein